MGKFFAWKFIFPAPMDFLILLAGDDINKCDYK